MKFAASLFLSAAFIGSITTARPSFAQQTYNQARAQSAPPSMPKDHGDKSVLVLPPVTGPRLVAPPPTIQSPTLPSAFIGCWEGDPHGFDWSATDSGLVALGGPGKITFCYSEHDIDVPEAHVRISPAARAVDWFLHFGVGFSTFTAHGISTDIFAITDDRIRGRTTLVVTHRDHWLYFIPTEQEQPSEVDWIATRVGPETTLVKANQVISDEGLQMWGEWHAFFHRIGAR